MHWGFFATLNTPPIDGSNESGIHNVYTGWYVADAQISAWYTFLEGLIVPMMMLILAGNMVYHNHTKTTEPYLYVGIVQILATYVYVMNNAIIMTYNVLNSVYLQSRYPIDTWVTIQFGTLWNFFNQDGDFLRILVYLEQLFIGNKRLALYSNFMMAVVTLGHPITLPFSMYWWSQVPIQAILDLIVYPIWPQFDTPQIPW